jgi:tetratricopeptide (TPR) repeat protein
VASNTAAELAARIEADLDEFPDERGEILLEAAEQWHRAGQHDRAIARLEDVVALGGEDGEHAQVALADMLFDLGQVEQAHAQLDTLRQSRPSSAGPCHLVGELLEEYGEFEQALTWFNMAISRLTEEEMAARSQVLSYAGNIVAGRRRVREALGLPSDELDISARERAEAAKEWANSLTPQQQAPSETRVLFWPRAEIPRAHEMWPEVVALADPDAVIAQREAANRELAESGTGRISMVPLTVARLVEFAARTGGDPADEDTRLACMAEIVDEGGAISWPPERNVPCWCGSGKKYKKCCGRPANAVGPLLS